MGTSSQNEDSQRAGQVERITVALIARAADDLRQIQARTGLSKTDAVNRAISVYDFIDRQLTEGNDLILRSADTGKEQLVRFL
jgi:hypothetical protein